MESILISKEDFSEDDDEDEDEVVVFDEEKLDLFWRRMCFLNELFLHQEGIKDTLFCFVSSLKFLLYYHYNLV
jgi:hypothetical protein